MNHDRVGLCARCSHARVTGNRRGSRFWLCRRATDDPTFRKYPPLPVRECRGFELAPPDPWEKFRESAEEGSE